MLSQLQDVPGVVKLLGQCLSSPDGDADDMDDADEEALGVLMLELLNPLTLYSFRSGQLVQIIKSLIQVRMIHYLCTHALVLFIVQRDGSDSVGCV